VDSVGRTSGRDKRKEKMGLERRKERAEKGKWGGKGNFA